MALPKAAQHKQKGSHNVARVARGEHSCWQVVETSSPMPSVCDNGVKSGKIVADSSVYRQTVGQVREGALRQPFPPRLRLPKSTTRVQLQPYALWVVDTRPS